MNKVITKIRSGIGGYLKDNILFLTFVFASVLNGFLLRAFTVKFNYSQIKPLMADMAVILLLALISYVFKKPRKQFVYLLVLTIIFSILCTANSIYYTNYKSFISVSLISTASQLGGVMDAVTENIMEPKDLIFLWDIPVIIVVYILLKRRTRDYITEVKEKRKRRGYALGTFCSTLTGTDYSRLAKQWNREYVLGTFGLYTYQFSDVISCTHAKINMMFGYEESEEVFNKFYDDKSKTEETSEKSNKYTNIFKGKNIIVIHAESFQQFCMDTYINGEELTPNMNKLAREGLYFSTLKRAWEQAQIASLPLLLHLCQLQAVQLLSTIGTEITQLPRKCLRRRAIILSVCTATTALTGTDLIYIIPLVMMISLTITKILTLMKLLVLVCQTNRSSDRQCQRSRR